MTAAAFTARDGLRSVARRLLRPAVYRIAADALNAAAVLRSEGFGGWRRLTAAPRPGETQRAIELRGLDHALEFRPGTPDVGAIVQNLVRHEYGRLPPDFAPRLIVDAGGYIGDVSLYFLNRYPRASLITLEPDAANFELAARNLAPYGGRARLLRAGLWSRPATLRICGEFTAARLTEGTGRGEEVPCTTLDTLLAGSEHEVLDLLKLDIEGAEEEVLLNRSEDWLRRTRALVVEFHSAGAATRCTRHLLARGYTGFRYRSLCYFHWRAPAPHRP